MNHPTPSPGRPGSHDQPLSALTAAGVMLLVITLVLLVASCSGQATDNPSATAATGDSKTEPTGPTDSASPSPSASPTEDLDEAEQRAYEGALAAAKKHEAAVAAAIGHPSVEAMNALNRSTVDPFLRSLQNNFYEKIDFDQRGEIRREVTTVTPVKVELEPQSKIRISSRTQDWKPHNYRLATPSPVVVIDTCVTSTVVRPLVVDGKKVVKSSKPGNQHFYVSRQTLTQPQYLKGKWAVTWADTEEVDSC